MLGLGRRVALEFVGTALLLAAIVGSGIMAQNLSDGNLALALLCNAIATAGALVALIATLGPLCGAHLNPIVTLGEAVRGARPWREVVPYAGGQIAGGIMGVGLANVMFGKPVFFASRHVRAGWPELLAESVATFGLLFVIFVGNRARPAVVPFTVAAYITAAYWFTSSTSFANPAVTIARSLSDTFAGIRPVDVPGFVIAELAGAGAALAFIRWTLGATASGGKAVELQRSRKVV
jgi:glycerol uptake facilitator-like aquaporin